MSSFKLQLLNNLCCLYLTPALSQELLILLIKLFRFFQQYFLFGLFFKSVANSKHRKKLQKLLLLSKQLQSMSDESEVDTPPKAYKISPIKATVVSNDRQIELLEQNKNLRRKLKQLSARLDDQLEKAAKQKLKANISYIHATSPQSQSLQLQNAYKMIERLQKTVKDFESKQAYQVSFKRILDLQSIIKKKDGEVEDLKIQLKDSKKLIRDKQKHVSDLLDKQAVNPNLNEQKEQIQKLKNMIKKYQAENDELKKKQLEKHKKLVTAERRIVEMQQQDEQPIGRQQQLLQKLEQWKSKYKQAMMRIQKQNSYITKLNTKLSSMESQTGHKRQRSYHTSQEQKQVSRSMDELPDIPNGKIKPTVFDHIPSPNIPPKMLRRY